MALSVRTRFEIFKRDEFTCQYCGRKSPDVVLEVDHIIPDCEGGTDDTINLTTACWDCNRGKAGKPLSAVMTGEDPHDKALLLLERERQLAEYNAVAMRERAARETDGWNLVEYWKTEQGYTDPKQTRSIRRPDWHWLFSALTWCPREQVKIFMDLALQRGLTKDLRYVAACCRNWRNEHLAARDWREAQSDY